MDEASQLAYQPSTLLMPQQWFDNKKTYLDTLETQLKGLVKAVELVSKHGAGVSELLTDNAFQPDLVFQSWAS